MSKKTLLFLVLIIVFGAFLRLWRLGSDELIFDEGLYAFRSIGYLDYLESAEQPTPIQWLADQQLPFWTRLSFHDHPPLFFLIQHIFFRVLGDSLFIARLPSALAGIASIFLAFLIGRELFRKSEFSRPPAGPFRDISGSDWAGLLSALIAGVVFSYVSISRLSMMEAVLFFFILLNFYFFIRLIDHRKYWLVFGITLGLALLTKYISFFLMPAYIFFLVILRSPLLRSRHLYGAFLVAALIFAPVVIYNIYFYKTFGHFDLQFSYLLGQETPEWRGLSGKTQEPFANLGENLLLLYSLPFLALAAAGLVLALLRPASARSIWLMILAFFFITLLLIFVGSAIRFVALYAIPAVFLITFLLMVFLERYHKNWLVFSLFMAFVAYEIFFGADLLFINPPDYGVAKLDNYFDSIFKESRPAGFPSHPNQHLNRVIERYALSRLAILEPTGIIYDDDLATSPRLWIFSRRQYYQGIPIMPARVFEETLETKGKDFFKGFNLYFVKTETAAPLHPLRRTAYAEKTEAILRQSQIEPAIVISGANNEPAFKVYRFSFE